jgi:hypothetical protein
VSNLIEQRRVEQSRAALHSTEELFRLRMESQCDHIKRYRLRVLRETGRLISVEAAAREWIESFAATFDDSSPGSGSP